MRHPAGLRAFGARPGGRQKALWLVRHCSLLKGQLFFSSEIKTFFKDAQRYIHTHTGVTAQFFWPLISYFTKQTLPTAHFSTKAHRLTDSVNA